MEKLIININQLNNDIKNNAENYIKLCEENYIGQMEKIVESVKMDNQIKFIRLTGPSSSGKTTTANLLAEKLIENEYHAKVISLDDFFVDREKTPLWENGDYNYETADAIDWQLFDECINNLLTKGGSKMPTYNFYTGTHTFDKILTLHEKDIIIIEGLHSLNPIMDNFIKSNLCLKVYLAPFVDYVLDDKVVLNSIEMRFFRRLIRDVYTRGTSPEETLLIWNKVMLGEKLYIDPFKDTANFTINTAHPYEICIYKYIIDELKLNENKSFEEKLNQLKDIARLNKKYCPANSLLQEFVH